MAEKLTPQDVLDSLLKSDPEAFTAEQETGWFVIDGRFNLEDAARILSERLAERAA